MNTAIKAGNHWIPRQKRAAARWADPAVPEYEPCWKKWIAFRLMLTCGLRSIETRWARRHWLQEGRWLDDQGREWRGWALVVKHYPEDPPMNPGGKMEYLPGF